MISAKDTELPPEMRRRQIKAGIERYSRDMPQITVTDVTGDGGRYYDLTGGGASIASWVDGFSQVLSIEYPAITIANDETPVFLEPEDWIDDYEANGVIYLYLPHHAPAATEAMRIRHTVPYLWTTDSISTPGDDFYAVCHLIAGLCCQAIAAKYARSMDSTITADAVDHGGRFERFSTLSGTFMKRYYEHIGVKQSAAGGTDLSEKPGGAFVNWDTSPDWPTNRKYLFRRRR
ncbi:MAG: hypothetical protein GY938_27090 [Ketobacter sp.]|nr:hypothetical protein [Ketobacter sp.]